MVKAFIKRIKEVNPLLNCVVDERFNDAISDANAADNLIKSGKFTDEQLAKEKPFLGVPISTKDCLAVKGILIHYIYVQLMQKSRNCYFFFF